MRASDNCGPAPDFTTACLVMFGINIAWIFMVAWAVWGILAVGAIGWAVNYWIKRVEARRAYEPDPTPEIT